MGLKKLVAIAGIMLTARTAAGSWLDTIFTYKSAPPADAAAAATTTTTASNTTTQSPSWLEMIFTRRNAPGDTTTTAATAYDPTQSPTPVPTTHDAPRKPERKPPWERTTCTELYGKRPERHGPPITKTCWDSQPVMKLPKAVLDAEVPVWPAPADQRGTTDEWLAALKPQARPSANCFSSRMSTKDRDRDQIYVILDEAHRAVYVSNLKSGSSTMNELLLSKNALGAGLRAGRIKNQPTMGPIKNCHALNVKKPPPLARISAAECGGKCNLTCARKTHPGKWVKFDQMTSRDIPDEIMDRYFFFSFVRDPFVRSESSFYEATGHNVQTRYEEVLRGGRVSRNVHFRGQTYGIFSPGQSGRALPIHFIGKLEQFEKEWKRLQRAMTPAAVQLTPKERIALIAQPPQVVESKAARKDTEQFLTNASTRNSNHTMAARRPKYPTGSRMESHHTMAANRPKYPIPNRNIPWQPSISTPETSNNARALAESSSIASNTNESWPNSTENLTIAANILEYPTGNRSIPWPINITTHTTLSKAKTMSNARASATKKKKVDNNNHVRTSKEGHSIHFQPSVLKPKDGKPAPARDRFKIEQELEVCRRYLQDLVCFDYSIPRSCIEHANAVF